MPNRRDFLKTTTAAGGKLLTGGLPLCSRRIEVRSARRGPLNLLFSGHGL
jgi:hypothetical protein